MKKSISMEFLRYSNGELNTFTGRIDLKLTGNANFPEPVPTLTELRTKAQAFEVANDSYERGNKLSKLARDTARELLLIDLNQLANYVQFTANYDEEKLLTSGFPLRKDRTPAQIPLPPAILSITDGNKSGEVKIKLESQDASKNFTTKYRMQEEGAIPGYKFGDTKKTYLVDGLTPGKYYYFQVMVTNTAGESDWSPEQLFLVR